MKRGLPAGTVTFLFTDVEQLSETELEEELGLGSRLPVEDVVALVGEATDRG